jgi:hypothetical protein
MTPAERYRQMALELKAKAAKETNYAIKVEWETLAAAYDRLAEQAERNALTDIVYETPPSADERPVTQQQQQIQPKTDSEKE